VSVNRNLICFHKQMDGIFACLQKPKLGTQMGLKGTPAWRVAQGEKKHK
jgi:hypothetical protein